MQRTASMKKKKLTDGKITTLVDKIAETYKGDYGINFIDASNLPVRGEILKILDLLFEVLFPGHTGNRIVTRANVKFVLGDILYEIYTELADQIERAYQYQCRIKECENYDRVRTCKNRNRHPSRREDRTELLHRPRNRSRYRRNNRHRRQSQNLSGSNAGRNELP